MSGRAISTISSRDALAALWGLADQPKAALAAVELPGTEPVLPSSFAVGTAAQASIAAAALAAGELWQLRSGRRQSVSVDMRDAAIEFRREGAAKVGAAEEHARDARAFEHRRQLTSDGLDFRKFGHRKNRGSRRAPAYRM